MRVGGMLGTMKRRWSREYHSTGLGLSLVMGLAVLYREWPECAVTALTGALP